MFENIGKKLVKGAKAEMLEPSVEGKGDVLGAIVKAGLLAITVIGGSGLIKSLFLKPAPTTLVINNFVGYGDLEEETELEADD